MTMCNLLMGTRHTKNGYVEELRYSLLGNRLHNTRTVMSGYPRIRVACDEPSCACVSAGRRVRAEAVGGSRQCAAVRAVGRERRRRAPRGRPAHARRPLRARLREARRAGALSCALLRSRTLQLRVSRAQEFNSLAALVAHHTKHPMLLVATGRHVLLRVPLADESPDQIYSDTAPDWLLEQPSSPH